MPKFFSDTIIFNYSWDQVAQGFWKRYPNPNSKHVLTEDTVEREIRSGKLFSKRLLSKTNSIPKWAERFISAKQVNIIEETIVDPTNKVLTTYTRNLGYVKVMSVTEKVVYMESEEHPGKTVALRYAWIDSQVKGFSRAICAFGYERFKKNCHKMCTHFGSKSNFWMSYMRKIQCCGIHLRGHDGFKVFVVGGFNHVLSNLYSHQNSLASSYSTAKATAKLKHAAKNASELAKSKAAPIYASLHPNQS